MSPTPSTSVQIYALLYVGEKFAVEFPFVRQMLPKEITIGWTDMFIRLVSVCACFPNSYLPLGRQEGWIWRYESDYEHLLSIGDYLTPRGLNEKNMPVTDREEMFRNLLPVHPQSQVERVQAVVGLTPMQL
jgi:hypothetical protein